MSFPNEVAGVIVGRSGTITTGGTPQQVMAANPARRYFLFQNPSGNAITFWVSFLSKTPAAASPAIEVKPGGTIEFEGSFVPIQEVYVYGATTGVAYTAKEGIKAAQ